MIAQRETGTAAGWLLREMAADIAERAAFMQLRPARSLILGDASEALGGALPGEVIAANPATLDEEQPLPAGPFDLIASIGLIDTVNDVPGALVHIRNALAPEGVAILTCLGAGSLPRLRAALLAADGDRPAARIHPQLDSKAAAGLLQRTGFSRQVSDSHGIDVSYTSLDRLVADLRDQGQQGALASSPPPLTREQWDKARSAFLADADERGRVSERFELLTLTGWR